MQTRKRHQSGCVVQRRRQGKLAWVGMYRDSEGKLKYTEPLKAKTKSEAKSRLAEFLQPINAERNARFKDRNMTVAAYVEHYFIPLKRGTWKKSTAGSTESRIRKHIVKGHIGSLPISKLDREHMQVFLNSKATYSQSIVDHLRFDLSDIIKLAHSDGLIERNQTEVLFTPRQCAPRKVKATLTSQQVRDMLDVLDLRERLFVRLAVIAGLRPGEIIALKWTDIHEDYARVDKDIYRGHLQTTKNDEARDVSLSPLIRRDLEFWKQFANMEHEWVFASERGTPLWYQNVWNRHIEPKIGKIGLDWADYQVMRRTNATLMEATGADPKTAAAQRGHDIGVSIREYTDVSMVAKAEVVSRLEAMIQ